MNRRHLFRCACAGLAVAALPGCEPDGPAPVGTRAPAGGQMYPWVGPFQALFEDGVDPAAVGTALEAHDPAADPLLKQRTQVADLVARMRVQTVQRDAYGERVRYVLVLQVGYVILKPRITDPVVELSIPRGTPAFEMLSSNESTLRGRVFIGFVKRFVGANGPELHWHLTADTVEVARAIETASALQDLAH